MEPDRNTSTLCPECGERFYLQQYNGKATPPFPQNWHVYAVHDHEPDKPNWVVCVFYREPKGRYPLPAKLIKEEQLDQRKRVVAAKRAANAAKPGTKNRSN